jgi:DNA excision repair protein ERCC-3
MSSAKADSSAFNAYFYTLVSSDTKESFFSVKRQQYLVDQGYTFKVVQDLAATANRESVVLHTHEQEMALLQKALTFRCDALDAVETMAVQRTSRGEDEGDEEPKSKATGPVAGVTSGAKRKMSTLVAMSGGGDIVYQEKITKK